MYTMHVPMFRCRVWMSIVQWNIFEVDLRKASLPGCFIRQRANRCQMSYLKCHKCNAVHAAGLAGVVTADLAASHPQLGAAQRKLQSSCAALSSVEGFLHSSVTAVLAAALVQVSLFQTLDQNMDLCMPAISLVQTR